MAKSKVKGNKKSKPVKGKDKKKSPKKSSAKSVKPIAAPKKERKAPKPTKLNVKADKELIPTPAIKAPELSPAIIVEAPAPTPIPEPTVPVIVVETPKPEPVVTPAPAPVVPANVVTPEMRNMATLMSTIISQHRGNMTRKEVEELTGSSTHAIQIIPFFTSTGFYIEIKDGTNTMRMPNAGEMPLFV